MKRTAILALAGLLLLTGGCLGSVDPDLEGSFTAQMGGEEWRGTAQTYEEGDTLVIRSHRRQTASAHRLILRVVESAPGAYAVVTTAMSGNATRYEEEGGAKYTARASAGTISFREINRGTGRAVGTVQLTLQGERGTVPFQGEFDAYFYRDAYVPR